MHFSKAHRWTRRQALWLMTGAIAGSGLHACAKPAAAPSGESAMSPSASAGTMTINMGIAPWIGFTPLHIAIEKGFYKALGLDLKTKVFDTNAQTFPAFTAGQVDGFAPVTSEAITLASKGVDLKIVMVEDNSLGADVVLARNSIKSIQDFKGKRIAVEIGGIGHFFVLQILAEAGLTGKDVTLVNTPPDAAAIAYQTGKIDIAYSYSPFSEKAIAAQKDGRVIYSSKQMPTAIVDVYLFSTKFCAGKPQSDRCLCRRHLQGRRVPQDQPQRRGRYWREGAQSSARRTGSTASRGSDRGCVNERCHAGRPQQQGVSPARPCKNSLSS